VSFLLFSVIVTNTYLCKVIAELNSPLRGKRIKNSTEMHEEDHLNSNEFSLNSTWLVYVALHRNSSTSKYDYNFNMEIESKTDYLLDYNRLNKLGKGIQILSKPYEILLARKPWLEISNPFSYLVFDILYNNISICRKPSNEIYNSSYCTKRLRLMSPYNRHFPSQTKTPGLLLHFENHFQVAIEEELVHCKTTVYLNRPNEFEFAYMTKNYLEKSFYYLRYDDGIEFGFNGWGFFGMEGSKVKQIFDGFISSGIYHFDYLHYFRQKQLNRRTSTLKIRQYINKGFALNMKSSIQTIFVLYFVLIGISRPRLHGPVFSASDSGHARTGICSYTLL